jgi:hypothetical protein
VGSLEGTLGHGALFGPNRYKDDLSSRISEGCLLGMEGDVGPQGSSSENPKTISYARIEDLSLGQECQDCEHVFDRARTLAGISALK